MEINELKIFLAVSRQGSISRAAEELHYVQSNVTARIKQLEERLGVSLFHRQSKGVSLTRAGQRLVGYAEQIIQLTKEAAEALDEHAAPQGPLMIGSMETTAAVRLPTLLAAYHRRYPSVEVNLLTAPSEASLKGLLDFQLDGALVAGKVTHQELVAEPVYEEELVMVAPVGADPFEQAELKILVFRAGCSYRAQLEAWLRQTGRVPYRIVELGSIEGIIGCIAAGMGISFLPRSVVDRPAYRQNCSLHQLPDAFGKMTTWFVRRRNEKAGKALQAFRDLLLSA